MNLISGNGRFGNPDLKPEKTVAYEFGLSHQLLDEYLINVSVYSKKITDLTGVRTFFAGDSSLTGESYFETFTLHINEDFAYNNGIELQLRKLRGDYWYGELNYTYSVAEGSSSRPLERVGSEEANRQSLKFFPLRFDQRHAVNASLTVYEPELKVRASLLFQYGSGLPYTKGIRGATEEYEVNNARLPANWTLDLKMDMRFEIDRYTFIPYLEVYNITNRENVLYVDPFTGKPDYIEGRTKEWADNPANYGAPRLIYLGVRFSF
jgi:outer membrane receptor protein involved in Fe transport